MLQQNITSNQLPVKILSPGLIDEKNTIQNNNSKATNCEFRNKNGWCSKSERKCLLVNDLFFKH